MPKEDNGGPVVYDKNQSFYNSELGKQKKKTWLSIQPMLTTDGGD